MRGVNDKVVFVICWVMTMTMTMTMTMAMMMMMMMTMTVTFIPTCIRGTITSKRIELESPRWSGFEAL